MVGRLQERPSSKGTSQWKHSVALGRDALCATGNTESGSANITPGKEQKETFLSYARGNRRDRKAFATRSTTQGSLMKQKLSAVRDTAAVLSHLSLKWKYGCKLKGAKDLGNHVS